MVVKINSLFAFCVFWLAASVSAADTNSYPPFSPYADLTINAHWDSQYQDMEPMDLVSVSQLSGLTHHHLAFITDAGNCNPAWGGYSGYLVNNEWGKHLTDKLQAHGVAYTIAFGGASGSDLSAACEVPKLVSIYEKVILTYQPEGLDFDIENGSANVISIMTALKQIQTTHSNIRLSFTLPTLPEGLTAEGQEVVQQAKNTGLNYHINIMAMDYGPAYSGDMAQYAEQAATNLFSFLKGLYPEKTDSEIWNMIEITPMIGVNDVSIEQFTLQNADTLRAFANEKQIGGLSYWSVARDNPCADQWASPTCSGNHLQSVSYEFAKHFLITPKPKH